MTFFKVASMASSVDALTSAAAPDKRARRRCRFSSCAQRWTPKAASGRLPSRPPGRRSGQRWPEACSRGCPSTRTLPSCGPGRRWSASTRSISGMCAQPDGAAAATGSTLDLKSRPSGWSAFGVRSIVALNRARLSRKPARARRVDTLKQAPASRHPIGRWRRAEGSENVKHHGFHRNPTARRHLVRAG